MGSNLLSIDRSRYLVAVLIDPKARQESTGAWIDLFDTITYDAHHNLSPRPLAPSALTGSLHIVDILEYSGQRSSKQILLLIIHCDDDEEFNLPWHMVQLLSQVKTAPTEF